MLSFFRVFVNGEDVVVAAGGYGWDGNNVIEAAVDFFIISNRTYQQSTNLVAARRNMNSVVIDGLFYFWGGNTQGGGTEQSDGYRMLSNGTWESVSEVMSAPAEGGYAVVHYVGVIRKGPFTQGAESAKHFTVSQFY